MHPNSQQHGAIFVEKVIISEIAHTRQLCVITVDKWVILENNVRSTDCLLKWQKAKSKSRNGGVTVASITVHSNHFFVTGSFLCSGCRLVYICRDPKDALVSFFHFGLKIAGTLQQEAGQQSSNPATTFEEAFELFSDGRCIAGPQWRHAREYWQESQRWPGKVLFLRYEVMLRDPVGNLKNLAAFIGCAFSEEEEEAGVVHKIVELCSLENLESLDVNKNGSTVLGTKNDTFFRKGCVGDWRNHMTPEMAARLDKIVEEALQGSGLSFASSV